MAKKKAGKKKTTRTNQVEVDLTKVTTNDVRSIREQLKDMHQEPEDLDPVPFASTIVMDQAPESVEDMIRRLIIQTVPTLEGEQFDSIEDENDFSPETSFDDTLNLTQYELQAMENEVEDVDDINRPQEAPQEAENASPDPGPTPVVKTPVEGSQEPTEPESHEVVKLPKSE